ncbi:MAG: hypothetical protein QW103_00895 [Candidatus Pacearchaeota archaeon]
MFGKLKKILSKEEIKLIIFGETHGFIDDSKYQEEVLKIFKPTIFLYEMLEEKSLSKTNEMKNFLTKKDDEKFSFISKYGELKKTVKLALRYKVPIIGIDFKNMLRKNNSFLKKRKLTKEDIKIEKIILRKREERQKNKILEFFNKEKRIFVSVGVYHLRKKSPLLSLPLKYFVIYPTYNKKIIFYPPKRFKIKNLSFKFTFIKNR